MKKYYFSHERRKFNRAQTNLSPKRVPTNRGYFSILSFSLYHSFYLVLPLSVYLSLHLYLSTYSTLSLPDWVSSSHAIVFWLVSRTVERRSSPSSPAPAPPPPPQCGMAFREREQPFLVRRASEEDGRLRFSRDPFLLAWHIRFLAFEIYSAAVAGCRRRHIRPLFRGFYQ